MRTNEVGDRDELASEIDLRALGAAIKRRRRIIIVPTLLAFVGMSIFVNVVTPRYTAETQILLENQESFFTRPDRVNLPQEQAQSVDQEAVASQVQLIGSRDIARRAIKQLGLAGNPEFDPLAGGLNPLKRILILLGVVADPTRQTPENRLIDKFLEKLTVFSPPKTRVITVQFSSRDADLAVRGANVVAQLYLQEQSAAKRASARRSAEALQAQIADLRSKLIASDDAREKYRTDSGLLAGSNNMTISGQQLAEINSELSKARTAQADAQAKASMIRELIKAGKETDVSDVTNNELVRRVSEQLVASQAQLARDSRILLPEHPRIKELTAQVADFRNSLKTAAKKAVATLENEARIAGQRVTNLESVLTQQKKLAGVANVDEVHLRSLERVTQSYKDQLESSTARYQEALSREASNATPADARIISGASRPEEPSFPKKIPFIAFGTVAALLLSIGFVAASELLGGRAGEAARVAAPTRRDIHPEPAMPMAAVPMAPATMPASSWNDAVEAQDPVFGPVAGKAKARPSVDKLSLLASGGMLDATLSYLKTFGRSAVDSRDPVESGTLADAMGAASSARRGWDDEADLQKDTGLPAVDTAVSGDVRSMSTHIVGAHVPGRGLHIVGTGFGAHSGAALLVELGRDLGAKGRTIVVDLNRGPAALAALAADRAKVADMKGLAELLAGLSSFAEVIHRDHASRLHFIPAGQQEADFRDFDLILDALSETYDFILLLTPSFPQSEIAKVMAPYADFIVLAMEDLPGGTPVAEIEGELIAAGAKEVLVAGRPIAAKQDVA